MSYGGGDAGGGNATSTYSYVNYNDLDVQMRQNGYVGFQGISKNGAGGQTDAEGNPFPTDI